MRHHTTVWDCMSFFEATPAFRPEIKIVRTLDRTLFRARSEIAKLVLLGLQYRKYYF